MSKLPQTLIALSLALALAASPAIAQQVTTSHGVRTLPRLESMTSEAQYRQAVRLSEDTVSELLQDLASIESARTAVNSDAAGLADKVKRANADYDRAKTAFETIDKQYRTDLDAFNARQAAVEADIQQQRAAAAAISPSMALADYNREVARVNDWAARIASQRTALEAERNRLLESHANVEEERTKLARQKADAEARLKEGRDATVVQHGSNESKRADAYRQLRVASNYLRTAREQLSKVSKGKIAPSQMLEQASTKLREWEARSPAAGR